jgi:hypothetical protein
VKQEDLIATALAKAEAEMAQLRQAQAEVQTRLVALRKSIPARGEAPSGTHTIAVAISPPSTALEKVRLFQSVFRGRTDVFPRRWENRKSGKAGYSPACSNDWVPGVCGKPKVKCSECPNQAFIPLDERTLLDHLRGKHTAGVYPLLPDDTCWFLAADFDEESWKADVAAFATTCRKFGLPVAIERSRSGNGAHAWLFFASPVSARDARAAASHLITETMRSLREFSLRSYDRLFPTQDTMPKGGFGNLIALPFQFEPRKVGHSLFLNDDFEPFAWEGQWQFLAGLKRITPVAITDIANEARRTGKVIGVPAPASDPEEVGRSPWDPGPVESQRIDRLPFPIPNEVKAVLAGRLFIAKEGLPPSLLSRFRRLAAFQNPEFYKRQSLRLTTGLTPRVIVCAEDIGEHLALPRGCREEVEALLAKNDARLVCEDRRVEGAAIPASFNGTLTDVQTKAVAGIVEHEIGVLVAPPASGKTVMGASLIAKRAVSTLVLVHRRPLLDQWVNQLAMFLGTDPATIGQIRGGRRKPTGVLDVAMIQCLVRKDVVDELVAGYGQVIVDECHHVPAVSFERVMNQVRAKYILGLTATPRRRDGHHPIADMQLGPVRHTIEAKAAAAARPFEHKLIVRETSFRSKIEDPTMADLYRELAKDDAPNWTIAQDVAQALELGRLPLVLTERREHVEILADLIEGFCRRVVVMKGGSSSTRKSAPPPQPLGESSQLE